METPNLKSYALSVLGLSKKFLVEDGDLDPTAFIITADDQLLRPMDLRDEVSKLESSSMIVSEAKAKNALAIVAIFIARSKDLGGDELELGGYSSGDIQSGSIERSILLTISGPGIRNWAISVPFRTVDDKILFSDEVEYSQGLEIGLFSGWSDQSTVDAC